jgi:hypothetical protein
MNALPAIQTNVYDGWILRFAAGYTKRTNSINPIYSSNVDLNSKIENAEQMWLLLTSSITTPVQAGQQKDILVRMF